MKLLNALYHLLFLGFVIMPLTLSAVALDPTESCPGANLNVAIGVNSIEDKTEGSNNYYQLDIPSAGDLTISLTTASNKPATFYLGTSCNGTDIYNGSADESFHSETFTVSSSTIVYVKISETNSNESFTISIDFTAIAANTPPIAHAGADQTITVGDDVTLDGTGSSDSDGSIDSYSWSDGSTGPTPIIIGLAEGTHTFTLTVTDDAGDTNINTDTNTVVITVNPVGNNPPIANAGADQTITVGDDVTLDGTGSSDSDGSIDSYSWSDGSTGPTPIIIGLAEGTHTFTLTVTDDAGDTNINTDTNTVVITVNPIGVIIPSASIADASITEIDDNTSTLDFTVTLDSAAPAGGVTVDYVTTDVTAISVTADPNIIIDFNAVNSTLTIPVGQMSGTISVPIIGDTVAESNEIFTLTLSNPTNATLGTASATGTIIDNDNSNSVPGLPDDGYTCGIFPSVLTSYEHMELSANPIYNSCNISYPEGEFSLNTSNLNQVPVCYTDATNNILCADEDGIEENGNCTFVPPPGNRYDHTFIETTDTSFTNEGSDIEFTDIEYGNYDLSSNGQEIHFNPVNHYGNDTNNRKVMLLGDFDFTKNTQELTFEEGDYYFTSLTFSGNGPLIQLVGDVRIYIQGDFVYAGNGAAVNDPTASMFVYVMGDFDVTSLGGGNGWLGMFVYVEGDVDIDSNSNSAIFGAITAEGTIDVPGNNFQFIYNDGASNFGLGDCTLCFERPRYTSGEVSTKIFNQGRVTVTDLNISKAYDPLTYPSSTFTFTGAHIDSLNNATANPATITVDIDGLANFPTEPNPSTTSGFLYNIGTYTADQNDTLYDSASVPFELGDYNTSALDDVKVLHMADYYDGDRYYHVMVERCGPWDPLLASFLTGPFDAWDIYRGDTDGDAEGFIDDKNISTKIASKPFDLTIANLDSNGTRLETKNTINTIEYALYSGVFGVPIAGTTGEFNATSQLSVNETFTVPAASTQVYVGFKFCASYDGNTYTLADDSVCTSSTVVRNCDSVTNDPEWHLCYSSDAFAVRPKEFVMTPPSGEDIELLRSGSAYNFTVIANNENNAATADYNQTDDNLTLDPTLILNDGTEDNASDPQLNGSLAFSSSNDFTFDDGTSIDSGSNNEVVGLIFDDVGIVTIGIQDRIWSIIDNDDTPQDCNGDTFNNGLVDLDVPEGAYVCGEENATFIPHHFSVSGIHLRNHRDGNFTYLSNDLNMSAHLDADISAMNANNAITQNFRQGSLYYENPVSVDLNVTDWNASLPAKHPFNNAVHTHDIPVATNLGFGGTDANGTHSIPWNESNATQQLMFNYIRQSNQTVNPFDLPGGDVNISVASDYTSSSGATETIIGSGIGDQNARFYYARTRPSKTLYTTTENSVFTPVAIDIYCDLGYTGCDSFDVDTVSGQTNVHDWWLSTKHLQSLGDGNVTLTKGSDFEGSGAWTMGPTVTPTIVNINSSGINTVITVTNTSNETPRIVGIDLVMDNTLTNYTNPWLLYNKDHPLPINPFYKVEFIGTSGWAGVGETGFVLENNASSKKTKRLNW